MIKVSDDNFETALLAVARDLQAGDTTSFDASALTPERKQEFLYALNDFFGGKLEGVAHTPAGDIDLAGLLSATKATEDAAAEEAADNAKVSEALGGDMALLLAIEHAKVRAGLAAADEFAPAEIAAGVKDSLLFEALLTTADKSVKQLVKAGEVMKGMARLRAARVSYKQFAEALDRADAADKLRESDTLRENGLRPSSVESNAFAPIRGCGADWAGPGATVTAGTVRADATRNLGESEADKHAASLVRNERECKAVLEDLEPAVYSHDEGFSALGRAEDVAAKGKSETDKTVLRSIYHVANNLKLRLSEIEFDTALEEYGFVLAIDEVTALIDKLAA